MQTDDNGAAINQGAIPGPGALNNPDAVASANDPSGVASAASDAAADVSGDADGSNTEDGQSGAGESDAAADAAQPSGASDSADVADAPQEPEAAVEAEPHEHEGLADHPDDVIAANSTGAASVNDPPVPDVIDTAMADAGKVEAFAGPFEASWIDCGGALQHRRFDGANSEAVAHAFMAGIREDGRTRDHLITDLTDV